MNRAFRPHWDEYFLLVAKLVATRSTCLACPVGAVIVKDRQILATGYNGPPAGSPHCTDQGFCYGDLEHCGQSRSLPSRSIHAEANAIAYAAKHGVSVNGAVIYATKEPCLACLKAIIAAGIDQVFYETPSHPGDADVVRDSFVAAGLVQLQRLQISPAALTKAVTFLEQPMLSQMVDPP
ncbi:CMP/dCMP deaminase zinc-binding protein [Prochlorothrix hollandica PCC 9006 = CALU 1027]|uniref:CMP/dCMP deaminase zinc-binding protein n=2 Tax=Prochlorothrix hollandica TaxID=1223 RepID=A0A0M2PX56_PROHO|nr:CMP/dCMP deaminase zinc-binding protein [Prochlorothrix hollandica PCC 9006 = CALU 1027]